MCDSAMANVYEDKNLLDMKINEYLIIKNEKDEVVDKRRYTKDGFKDLSYIKFKDFKKTSTLNFNRWRLFTMQIVWYSKCISDRWSCFS